jgi:hypothetical protein
VNEFGDIRADVGHVRVPVLYLATRADPVTEGTHQPRQLEAALASTESRFPSRHRIRTRRRPLKDAALRAELTRFLDRAWRELIP